MRDTFAVVQRCSGALDAVDLPSVDNCEVVGRHGNDLGRWLLRSSSYCSMARDQADAPALFLIMLRNAAQKRVSKH
jgi:hypothetical protein